MSSVHEFKSPCPRWNVVLLPKNQLCVLSERTCACYQDNIGELDTDRQEELQRARRQEEEEEEKGRKSALRFGSEDTFDLIASLEEKVHVLRLMY